MSSEVQSRLDVKVKKGGTARVERSQEDDE